MNTARAIAAEHIGWSMDHGMTPSEVCRSLGLRVRFPTWDDALLAVAIAWVEIAKTDRRAA